MKKFLRNKLTVVIIILSVAFLSLITYSAKTQNNNVVANSVGSGSGKIGGFFYTVGSEIKGFFSNIFYASSIKSENEELQLKNTDLEKKAVAYDNLIKENEELRKMLEFKETRGEYDYVGADITGSSTEGWLQSFIINKGSDDGIKEGLVALSPNGSLVGVIKNVSKSWSEIETVTSPNVSIACYISKITAEVNDSDNKDSEDNKDEQSTNDAPNGVLKGISTNKQTDPKAVINYIPIQSDVKKDDLVLTSGLGKLYPKDIVIGKVSEVKEETGKGMKVATIVPNVDFDKLNGVLIVIPKDGVSVDGEVKY
ncbi:rod shape-determining protein MreC [uncultured Clostridium sp.]|uniref:rod shape-determining protein MreC n=2 Tax=uncultured Clostridium sp. TaxID=59620 RepID=UPI0025D19E4A|nr:rod shape-determining protein MreC [uncultured Clostridium sp.]